MANDFHGRHNHQVSQLGDIVVTLRVIDCVTDTAEDPPQAFLHLRQESPQFEVGNVCIKSEGLLEVGEGSDGFGQQVMLELHEGQLAPTGPVKLCFFPLNLF